MKVKDELFTDTEAEKEADYQAMLRADPDYGIWSEELEEQFKKEMSNEQPF
jgi:hypothetical protein